MSFKKRTTTKEEAKRPFFDNGMKAGKYFSRSGFASAMDGGEKGIINKNVEDYMRGVGEGSYNIALIKPDGTTMYTDRPLNLHGRIYYPDANGVFTMVDKAYLEEQYRREQEKEEYLNEIVELASASDSSLRVVLGNVSQQDLIDICKAGGAGKNGIEISEDIDGVNCLPSIMRLYSKESLIFSQAVSKLRAIIMARAPIIDDSTGTRTAIRDETS